MSKVLTPTDRQRVADSLRRVEEMAHTFFYLGADWDSPQFPAQAAARLNEMARLLMAEQWHMQNVDDQHRLAVELAQAREQAPVTGVVCRLRNERDAARRERDEARQWFKRAIDLIYSVKHPADVWDFVSNAGESCEWFDAAPYIQSEYADA